MLVGLCCLALTCSAAANTACGWFLNQAYDQIDEWVISQLQVCNRLYGTSGPDYDPFLWAQCDTQVMIDANNMRAAADAEYYLCLANGCLGDYTADGTVNVDDLLLVINNWRVDPVWDDGTDTDDLLTVLDWWGDCPK